MHLFRNKKVIIFAIVILLLALSQWLMIKLVYAHKLSQDSAIFLAQIYNLKAGIIEDPTGDVNIYLEDFLLDRKFVNKLLAVKPPVEDDVIDLEFSDSELSELIWSKLLKLAWLNKLANENNIESNQKDIDYYFNMVGGQDKIEESIKDQGVSIEEYKYFLIEPEILEAKVYNYLIANFADQKGVQKIQEAYALLEAESGKNWDEVTRQYGEDTTLSDSSFWLSEEELVDIYEPIKEIKVGEFSKIIQLPMGYIIWHLDSISGDDGKIMREVRGLFVYAQGIDDFFNTYLESVNIKKLY